MNQVFVVSFAVLAACISTGCALHCFECQEGVNPLCKDPFTIHDRLSDEVPIKICAAGEVCLKRTIPAAPDHKPDSIPEMKIRGCAPPSKCNEEQFSDWCHTCSEELCNLAVRTIPSFINVIVLYIVKLIVL